MWTFACPTIIYGDNALNYILQLRKEKAFIVTDKNIVRLGLARRVTEQLDAARIQWRLFDASEAENTTVFDEGGWQEIQMYQPDWVIGVGGNACINAAKLLALRLLGADTRSDPLSDDPGCCSRNLRFMAIPTNSGNGTEDAWDMMLSPTEHGYNGHNYLPDVAILDPEMVIHMPRQNTADHGMDVICKAVEGYVSAWGSSITDGPALIAARQAFRHLPKAYQDGQDIPARMELQHAAFLAEISAGNAFAGLGFSTGRALRAIFNLPRGRAVGLLLPYAMEFTINGSLKTTAKYAEIARFCGESSKSDMDAAFALVAKIRGCAEQINQPLTIKKCGIGSRQLEEAIPELVDKSLDDVTAASVMRVPDKDELAEIFRYAFAGKTVDF